MLLLLRAIQQLPVLYVARQHARYNGSSQPDRSFGDFLGDDPARRRGSVGVLREANTGTGAVRKMARQNILVNDAYKDNARTRSALMRAYTALKERNDPAARDAALRSTQRTLDLSASETPQRHGHLVQIPGAPGLAPYRLRTVGEACAESVGPAMDRLVRDDDTAFEQQLLDVAQA